MAQAAEVEVFVRGLSAATAVWTANRRATPNERCVKRSKLPRAAFTLEAAGSDSKHCAARITCGLALCNYVRAVKAPLALAAMDAALKRSFNSAALALRLMTSARPLPCRGVVPLLPGWGAVMGISVPLCALYCSGRAEHLSKPCKPSLAPKLGGR